MITDGKALIWIRDLKIHFPAGGAGLFRRSKSIVKAVDGGSLEIQAGATMGLVGESGFGKTTLRRAILRLVAPTAGKILFRDHAQAPLRARQKQAPRPRLP